MRAHHNLSRRDQEIAITTDVGLETRDTEPLQSCARPLDLLTGQELAALQLRACGYSAAQVTGLMEQPGHSGPTTLQRAVQRLGGVSEAEAIATARRHGLID